MAVVMVSFDGRFFDRPVHRFDLAVGRGMLDLGELVLDVVFRASQIKHVGHDGCGRAIDVPRREGELDAPFDCPPAAVAQGRIVCQDSVDF
jgi:hypothetical protein